MNAAAAGVPAEGLTIHQVLVLASEACNLAAEVGAPVRSLSVTTHEGCAAISLHVKDGSELLAAALDLDVDTVINHAPDRPGWSGYWGGVSVVLFGYSPAKAAR